mgnify:CR=1 FL=1
MVHGIYKPILQTQVLLSILKIPQYREVMPKNWKNMPRRIKYRGLQKQQIAMAKYFLII